MGDDKKDALGNLIDFILSDDTPVGPEDEEDIELFNDAIAQAEAKLARMRLERARAGAFESGLTSKVSDIGIERAQRRYDRAKAGDATAGLTLAARFGDGTLDGDRDAILEDLAELEAEAEDENDEKN